MDEETLADRVGVLFGDLERLLQDLVGAEAAIDEPLDIADPVLDDLALLLQVGLGAGLAVPGYDRLDIQRLDAPQRCEPLPGVAFLQPTAALVKDVVAGEHDPFFRHMDRSLRRGVARHMGDVEGVIADIERQRVRKGQDRRVRRRVVRVPDQKYAVGVGFLEALAFLVKRAESIEVAFEALLQLDLPDDFDVRKIGVPRDVVAMRLGVDQIADRRLVFHELAPAHRIDRLLRRVDHDIAVAGLDKARIAAGEVDLAERVWSDPAHGPLLFSTSPDPPRATPRRLVPARGGTRCGRRRRTAGLIATSWLRGPARDPGARHRWS